VNGTVDYLWSILISICFLLFPSLAMAQVHEPLEFNGNRGGFGVKAADPFDVGTGIYYRTYVDLQTDGTIPIRFERTQRNLDLRSRSFWIGGSTSYDMFIMETLRSFLG
jgi:hypothetical protein